MTHTVLQFTSCCAPYPRARSALNMNTLNLNRRSLPLHRSRYIVIPLAMCLYT
jgi:hypothetical protein